MDFREIDRRYAELKRQHDAGSINAEEFDAQRKQLMVQDDEGRWWAKARDTGLWMGYTGTTWVLGTPPGYQPPAPESTTNQQSSYGAEVGYRPGPVVQPLGVSPGLSGNTSGMGAAATVPPEIYGWNWGAFLLNFIWALGNRAWGIAALTFVISFFSPLVLFIPTIIIMIVSGVKGNEWAWRSKRWRSVEHFRSTQRKWAWAGLIVVGGPVLLIILAIVIQLL